MQNYTEDNKDRNPEIEKEAFDILDCALMNAEQAVKIMKQKEKEKQEGESSQLWFWHLSIRVNLEANFI